MSKNERERTETKKSSYEGRRKKMLSITALVVVVVFLFWTIAGSLMSVWAQSTDEASGFTPVTAQSASSDDTMRGVWISTVYSLDYPSTQTTDPSVLRAQADSILDNVKAMGMNTVFLQVRTASDAFYNSSYFPWSKYLTGTQGLAPADGFDPLEYWVSAAHARGLELHAWINPYMAARSEADWAAMSADNPAKGSCAEYVIKYGSTYYYDPAEPSVRQLIINGALEIVNKYDVDGIHLDDYFYPGTDFNDAASFAKYGYGYSDIGDWRRNNVNQLIQGLDTALHAADSGISFGVSPQGIWANSTTLNAGSATKGQESYTSKYADTVAWVQNEWLDYIAPQIYWNVGYSIADYSVLAEWWGNIVRGTNVDLYIGMADYRSTGVTDTTSAWYGTSELQRQLSINRANTNIDGEIHFRYKSIIDDASLVNLYTTFYNQEINSTNNNNSNANGTTTPDSTTPSNPDTTVPGNTTDTPNTTVPTNPSDTTVPDAVVPDTNPSNTSSLNDISGHWAESYIKSLVSDGVISGMGDGTFLPDGKVTRAQFVKLIAGIVGDIEFSLVESAGFKDVDENEWYAKYVNWAAGAGIVKGMDESHFEPDASITREQMAVIIQNLAYAEEMNFGTDHELINFTDSAKISSWASEAIDAAVAAGILNGSNTEGSDGYIRCYFYPQGYTTRAEAAKVIYVLKDKLIQ